MSVVFTPHQGNVSLQQMETTTEDHGQSTINRELWSLVSVDIIYTTRTLKVQGTLRKGKGAVREPSESEGFAVRLCRLITSEVTHVKSNQYNHLGLS